MARTIRRKHYVPAWVTEDCYNFLDPKTGVSVWAGFIQLEGKARKKQLRWWHEDKGHYWGVRPPKYFRMNYEDAHRMDCKTEIARFHKDAQHEVMILPKKPLGYWD